MALVPDTEGSHEEVISAFNFEYLSQVLQVLPLVDEFKHMEERLFLQSIVMRHSDSVLAEFETLDLEHSCSES